MRPEDVERFKRDGAALLGKGAQVNEEAISQFRAMHQQLTESQAAQNEAKAEGALVPEDELSSQPDDTMAYDTMGAAKGLNDNAHGIDRFGYRVR